jgi:prolyl oligopeptidase
MIRNALLRFGVCGWMMIMCWIAAAAEQEDPYRWLEEVTSDKSLTWAKEQNVETVGELAETDGFKALEARLLSILDSDEKIPRVRKIGDLYYNFWRDAKNPRGLWRRTSLAEYRKESPNWELVIDLDSLAKAEGENWVWHGADVLAPADRLCLIGLSRGGADADIKREFDLATKQFVKNGYWLPEAKSQMAWRGPDSVFVGTDFGPGSMTSSGYPRIVKQWQRGTPLGSAVTVFEGKPEDMVVAAYRDLTPGFERDFIVRKPAFWSSELFLRRDGQLIRIEVPDDAKSSVQREWLLVELRTDWRTGGQVYPAGALLAIDFEAFLKGQRQFSLLFEPAERKSLAGYSTTRHHLLLNELDNVHNRLYVLTPPANAGGPWSRASLPGVPQQVTASAGAVDKLESDDYFLNVDGYLTPPTLALGTVGKGPATTVKTSPAFFTAAGLSVTQHETTSKDGTRIPYFQVAKKDLALNGTNRTLLYGYGGFEIALLPHYNPLAGAAWLEEGGVYVVANIRGGGEFGPQWHQAALKAKRHKAYEDFIAVAEDLIRRKVTATEHLGIMGGSNGGLLMGNMLTMRPDLFGAIVCQVPLLDMRRYHKLLAGASWMAEYGNPDLPDEWAFIKTFSPYHNVQPKGRYPRTLFTTSTRDDRVHPSHARKMVAKMKSQGHDILYYENIEGGHGGAANNAQRAFMSTLAYVFLWKELE